MRQNKSWGVVIFALMLVNCTGVMPEASTGASEPGWGAWSGHDSALSKLATACIFTGTATSPGTLTVTLLDGEAALISATSSGGIAVNGDPCVASGAVKKSSVKALVVSLKDSATAPADGRGVRVLLDYSGGALVTAGATTAPVTVTLGGRAQDEVWLRTTSKPDFVNVTAAGVVSVGSAATNTKKDIALMKVGGLSLFLGAGADVVKAGDAAIPITAYGAADADLMTTGSANDRLDGGDGDDVLTGGAGDDTLTGGPGDDTLDGQGGCDAYDGGDGVDTNLDDQAAMKVDGVEADFSKGRESCARDGLLSSLLIRISFDGNFKDSGPRGRLLTNTGVTLTTDRKGRENRAGAFAGGAELLSTLDDTFGSSSEVTVSAWVNPSVGAASDAYPEVASYGSMVACGEYMTVGLSFDGPSGGKAKGGAYKTCYGPNEVMKAVPIGSWSLLTVVYDTTKVRFYVDGFLSGEADWTFGTIAPSTAYIDIGGGLGGYTGKIDDVMIWGRALRSEEVQQLSVMD